MTVDEVTVTLIDCVICVCVHFLDVDWRDQFGLKKSFTSTRSTTCMFGLKLSALPPLTRIRGVLGYDR